MQRLVSADKEPITPFIAKVRALADVGPTSPPQAPAQTVSSILVLGGSGDYFAVADTVICMESYVPSAAIARIIRRVGVRSD
jgi:predicted ABC-class ATPase